MPRFYVLAPALLTASQSAALTLSLAACKRRGASPAAPAAVNPKPGPKP